MKQIPNPNEIYPNEYKTSVFLKNIITDQTFQLVITHIMMMQLTPQALKKTMYYLTIRNLVIN